RNGKRLKFADALGAPFADRGRGGLDRLDGCCDLAALQHGEKARLLTTGDRRGPGEGAVRAGMVFQIENMDQAVPFRRFLTPQHLDRFGECGGDAMLGLDDSLEFGFSCVIHTKRPFWPAVLTPDKRRKNLTKEQGGALVVRLGEQSANSPLPCCAAARAGKVSFTMAC